MHTVQTYLTAANERFVDAQGLLARGRHDAACYLAGYVVEMLLKHAAMVAAGAAPHDLSDTWRAYFWTTLVKPKVLVSAYESGHGLEFWRDAVLHNRSIQSLGPLARQWQKRTNAVVRATRRSWSVEMRYDSPSRTTKEAERLLEVAGWLLKNQARLWSKRGARCRY
jgi:hypothetical protein